MARILLVDDEAMVLSVLGAFLKAWGYDVVAMQDSTQALAALESSEPFDMLISDVRMVPVDGFQLLKVARRLRPGMPALVITGYGSDDVSQQARELGAAGYITKPFKPDSLLNTLESVLPSVRPASSPTGTAGSS